MPAITVLLPEDEARSRWEREGHRPATFKTAPGDRGTEIHVDTQGKRSDHAHALDELRHFKQLVETGEITRSDAVPEGERAERKLHQQPAQAVA